MKRVTQETLAKAAKRENRVSEKLKIARAKNLKLCKVTFKDANPRLTQKMRIRKTRDFVSNRKYQELSRI